MMLSLLAVAWAGLPAGDSKSVAYEAAWRSSGTAALNAELDAVQSDEAAATAAKTTSEARASLLDGADAQFDAAVAAAPQFKAALLAAFERKKEDAGAGRVDDLDRILAAGRAEVADLAQHSRATAKVLSANTAARAAQQADYGRGHSRTKQIAPKQISGAAQLRIDQQRFEKDATQAEFASSFAQSDPDDGFAKVEAELRALQDQLKATPSSLLESPPDPWLAGFTAKFNALQDKIAQDAAQLKQKTHAPTAPSSLAQVPGTIESRMEQAFEHGLARGFHKVHEKATRHVERARAVVAAAEAKDDADFVEADAEHHAVAEIVQDDEEPADEALLTEAKLDHGVLQLRG